MKAYKLFRINKINYDFMSIKIFILIFLMLACVFYYFFYDEAPIINRGDTKKFIAVVKDLEDFKIDKLHYRTIGYPILLILTNTYDKPSKLLYLISLLQYFFAVYCLSLVLIKLNFNKILLFLFNLTLSLPFFVQNSAIMMSENFTTFNLVIGFVLFLKGFLGRNNYLLFLSGLFWGFSSLVRPTYQFLIIPILFAMVIYIYIYIDRKRGTKNKILNEILIPSISLVVGFSLLVGLNIYINKTKFNFWGFTPYMGYTLSTKTVGYIERIPDNYKKEKEILIKYRNRSLIGGESHTALSYIDDAIPELMDSTGLDFIQLSKHIEKININLIKSAPMNYLKSVSNASTSYWLPYSSDLLIKNKFILLLNVIFQFLLMLIFFLQSAYLLGLIINLIFMKSCLSQKVFRIINFNKEYWLVILITSVIIFYTFFVTILVNIGEPRHRSPTDIFIVLFVFMVFNLLLKFNKPHLNK